MASELKVDTIKHTNNTSAITLDTSGNVTLAGSANNLGTVSAGTFNGTVGTTATVPASVGSSLVLVKSVQAFTCTNSDTLGTAYIQNCFNSTYRDYRIIITGTSGSAYTAYLRMLFGNSSTARNSTSGYYWSVKGYDSGGTARNASAQGSS